MGQKRIIHFISNSSKVNDNKNKKENNPLHSSQKWFIWGIAALFYLYETFLRVSPSVMTTNLMEDFRVTSTSLGVLSSFYYYAYVPMQIPCGLIVDKFGIRLIITTSCLLCVLGTLMFGMSENLTVAQLGRFILGAGSACAFISCLKITVKWFSPLHFALVAGLTNMMGTIGGLVAGRPLAMLVNQAGWRQASLYLAICGIPLAVVSWVFLKNSPLKEGNNIKIFKEELAPSLRASLSFLMKNSQIWLAGIIGGLMYLPISAFGELWGVPFLMHAYTVDNESASSISHMIFIGMAVGSPFAAWLLGRIRSIKTVMQLSSAIASFFFLGIAYSSHFPTQLAYLLVFGAGVFIGGQVLAFTIAKNKSCESISGTAIGFTNALVMMSGIIFQPLLGHILDFFWDGTLTQAGVRYYSTHAYQMSILTIPICLIFSVFLLVWIKEDKNSNPHLI